MRSLEAFSFDSLEAARRKLELLHLLGRNLFPSRSVAHSSAVAASHLPVDYNHHFYWSKGVCALMATNWHLLVCWTILCINLAIWYALELFVVPKPLLRTLTGLLNVSS